MNPRNNVMTFEEFKAREPEPKYPACRQCGDPVGDLEDTHCSTRCQILDMANAEFEIIGPYGKLS